MPHTPQEPKTERVVFLATKSQRAFLDRNTQNGSIGQLMRWLLDNHIAQVNKNEKD